MDGAIEGKVLEEREKSFLREMETGSLGLDGSIRGEKRHHSGGPLGQIMKDCMWYRWGEGLRNVTQVESAGLGKERQM